MRERRAHHSIFVGGGSAGLGPLVYAAGVESLDDFLANPITIIEGSAHLGSGTFGNYLINTNSAGHLFLECLQGERAKQLPKAARSDVAAEIERRSSGAVPMRTVSVLLRLIGQDIRDAFTRSARSSLLLNHRARSIHVRDDGYDVLVTSAAGETVIHGHRLVLATGGSPRFSRRLSRDVLATCRNAGASDVLLMHSDELLKDAGYKRTTECLQRRPGSLVLIVGGGDSAFSAAGLLLKAQRRRTVDADIVVLHRSPPKVTFENVEEAHRARYTDFTERDVCPQSGIVFRIGGLRHDSKELCLSMIDGQEPRMRLLRLHDRLANLEIEWAKVALVVLAIGYTCDEVPVYDASGAPVPLMGSFTGKYVDHRARILRSDGTPMSNVYAIGMGSGYLPMDGGFGGEPSFGGVANSVMLCQGPVGGIVFEELTGARTAPDLDGTSR